MLYYILRYHVEPFPAIFGLLKYGHIMISTYLDICVGSLSTICHAHEHRASIANDVTVQTERVRFLGLAAAVQQCTSCNEVGALPLYRCRLG